MEGFELFLEAGNGGEFVLGFGDSKREKLPKGFAVVGDREAEWIEALAAAIRTRDVNRGKKLELNSFCSKAVAGATHPTFVIVAEMTRHETARFGFWKGGKKLAQGRRKVAVGVDVGATGLTERILVDGDQLINRL